jgi:hypothetical protein
MRWAIWPASVAKCPFCAVAHASVTCDGEHAAVDHHSADLAGVIGAQIGNQRRRQGAGSIDGHVLQAHFNAEQVNLRAHSESPPDHHVFAARAPE